MTKIFITSGQEVVKLYYTDPVVTNGTNKHGSIYFYNMFTIKPLFSVKYSYKYLALRGLDTLSGEVTHVKTVLSPF